MNDKRPKQILDSTFQHLEKVLEEMRREKHKQGKMLKNSRQKSSKEKKND